MRTEGGFNSVLAPVLVIALLLESTLVVGISLTPNAATSSSPDNVEMPFGDRLGGLNYAVENLGAPAPPAFGWGRNISFSVSFEEPQFKTLDGYDLIEISGCGSTAVSPGAPTVPKKTVSVLLPPDGDVSSVRVTPAGSRSVGREVYLYPSQSPVLIGEKQEAEFTPPNPEIYGSSNPYPGESEGGTGSTALGLVSVKPRYYQLEFVTGYQGYRIAVLTLFPITYTPSERMVVFHQKLDVRIEVGEAADALAFNPTDDVREWVADNVVNPELMSTYESSGGSGSGSPLLMGLGSGAEYLIITRPMFVSALQPLINLKSERMSVKVVTIENDGGTIKFTVDNVSRTYPGRDVPEQIRNCIEDYYENHGTRWVLLAGDCDYNDLGMNVTDTPNYQLDQPWEVPVRYVWNPDYDDTEYHGHNYCWRPTDYYYAGLDGSWDADGDSRFGEMLVDSVEEEADWFAEVYVGRFSAQDVDNMQAIVIKTVAYEQNPPNSFENICLFGAHLWDDYADGKTLKEHIKEAFIPGDVGVHGYYHKDGTLSYGTFIDAVNTYAPGLVNVAAHGGPDGMSVDGTSSWLFADLNTPAQVTNEFLIYADSCLTNAFDMNGACLGEVMLRDPDGSAIGYIGGTRVEWGTSGDDFLTRGSDGQDVKFFEQIFQENEYRQGVALYRSKIDYLESGWYLDLGWLEERCNLFVTMLLGDPELKLIEPKVKVSVEPNYQSSMPGGTLNYTVVVANMDNIVDTYDLTASDIAGWSLNVESPLTVPPGESRTTTLSVTIPESVTSFTKDIITVVATSQADPAVKDSGTYIAYATIPPMHGPIQIVDNDDFTPANGVASGSGTADDPYIIENWVISAVDAHGILVKNTTAYFIIRNCLVENGGSTYSGIYLNNNVVNGRIENNTCENNYNGIRLISSSNYNTLTNNICGNNQYYGIQLAFSSYNTLTGNTCSNNYGGIYLYSSDNNTLTNNNCSKKYWSYGIYLTSSSNNNLTNNTCKNNYNGIYLYSSSDNNTLTGNTCSNSGYGGIYLYTSNSNNLTNNIICNCNDDSYCILLYFSSNNTLTGNTCENNDWVFGICLYPSSDNNTLTGNICSNNYQSCGIYLKGCKYNTLTGNTCENNSYGINLVSLSYNTLTGNTCRNNDCGICLYKSPSNTLTGNTCRNNKHGIYLASSSNSNIITLNYLLNNTVNNARESSCGANSWDKDGKGNWWSGWQPPQYPDANYDGIVDQQRPITGGSNVDNYPLVTGYSPSHNHTPILINDNSQFTYANGTVSGSGTQSSPYIIENWAISASGANGIYIKNTAAYFIVRNCLVENGGTSGTDTSYNGIYLDNVINGKIEGNICEKNRYGIYLYCSDNNTLSNNTCSYNTTEGITLNSSSNNTLTGNICSNNGYSGIRLTSSSNNTLTNNTCSNNQYGITVYYSSTYNDLTNNTCEGNRYGIYLNFSSNYNTLTNNTCSNGSSNGVGIHIQASSYNTLTNNTCSNDVWGIWLDSSANYNTLENNTCSNNTYGIIISSSRYGPSSNNNTITLNRLLNNTSNAYDKFTNSWDRDGKGNYWSDWQSPDENNDGIVDTPRPIAGGSNQDNKPLVIGWIPLHIAFDNASTVGWGGPAIASRSWSHTCSGSNRILFVGVSLSSGSVSSVTYGGNALTFLRADNYRSTRSEIWYLVDPPTGSNSVVVNFQSAISYFICGAISYTGVNQTSPIDNHSGANGSGMTASTSVTVNTTNSWVTAVLARRLGPFTCSDNMRYYSVGPMGAAGADKNAPQTIGSKTISFTSTSGSVYWAESIVSFKPA